MSITGDLIAKSRKGVFIAHEISDESGYTNDAIQQTAYWNNAFYFNFETSSPSGYTVTDPFYDGYANFAAGQVPNPYDASNNAYSFNGTSQTITFQNIDFQMAVGGSAHVAISCFVQLPNLIPSGVKTHEIFNAGNSRVALRVNEDQLGDTFNVLFHVENEIGGIGGDVNYQMPRTANMFHIGAIFKGSTFQKLFIDGVEVASTVPLHANVGSDFNGPLFASIGARHDFEAAYSNYFDGYIDELRFFWAAGQNGEINENIDDMKEMYEAPTSYSPIKPGIFANPKLFRAGAFVEEAYRESDAYFFPLGADTRGLTPTDDWDAPSLLATTKQNIAYDENGAFVGPATTNLWPNKDQILQGFQGDGTVSKIYATPVGLNKGVSLTKTIAGEEFDSLSPGNVDTYPGTGHYSVSAYVRHASGDTPSEGPDIFELAQGTGGAPITNTLVKEEPSTLPISTQWIRKIRTADYTGSNPSFIPNISWADATVASSEYRLYGMQIERLSFPTPYTDSSRSAAVLGFNLNSTIGLDWSADWTIMYWKKAVGTDSGLTGYSVESLGRNSNSVGGGYTWFGKLNASNALQLSSGTLIEGTNTFSWDDYQYNWHLVVVKYSATGQLMKYLVYGVNSDPIIYEKGINIPSANYFVTQDGIDFQLGGFDLIHQPAAYYRGLTIYKREWTDTDVTKYYNTKLKLFSGLEIYSGIILEEDL